MRTLSLLFLPAVCRLLTHKILYDRKNKFDYRVVKAMQNRCISMKGVSTMQDNDIVELYWQRSERAIVETACKYGKYAHSIAYNILHNNADAEECVNDAYLHLWNAIPPARPKHLQTFLGKIIRNLSLHCWEKQKAEKRGGGQIPLVLEELSECIPSPLEDGRTLADDITIKQSLEYFVAGLSADARTIFLRRYFNMDSIEKISADFGWSQSKVTVTLTRLRKKLKNVLKKEGIEI